MEPKILLIDGPSVLVSGFYATASKLIAKCETEEERALYYPELMQTSTGIYTNAVYSMTRELLKAIHLLKPTHIVVAFDVSRETTFRRTMYAQYKAQRKSTPAALKEQFDTMTELLIAMGITVVSNPIYEADDLIASMAKKYETEGKVYVWTKDRDYYQLASENTTLWMMQSTIAKADELFQKYDAHVHYSEYIPENCAPFTPYTVKAEMGVQPNQIPDLKGIMGDTSDNIPGIPGVISPAPKLISVYGNIETVIETCEKADNTEKQEKLIAFWKRMGISRPPIKKIIEGKEIGLLSKELATMKCDCEVPDLNEIEFHFDKEGYESIKGLLEFKSI